MEHRLLHQHLRLTAACKEQVETVYGKHASQLYIFCSDCSRNGKTLLCRLLASYLPDDEEGKFRIYDTDYPSGGIAHQFPERSDIIDFSRTAGQMQVFDTVLAKPGINHIVDLQSHHLNAFFQIYGDIEFEAAARDANVNVLIYYMLDKDDRSIETASAIVDRFETTEMVLVENDFIAQHNTREQISDYHGEIFELRKIRLPELSGDLLRLVEQPDFSLHSFMAGKDDSLPYELKLELWNLLEFFYAQRGADRTGKTHFL